MDINKRFQQKADMKSALSPSPKRVPDIDDSPLPIACTQEYSENIDVVWDWNSPQTKKHPKKCQKRLLLQSPKVPLKRHPSGSSAQDYEKLREELKCLREQLAVPDHEESLQLSPVEEEEYKSFNKESFVHQLQEDEFDELMDENINEQLFMLSQQVEEELKSTENKSSPQKSPFKEKLSPNIKFKKMNAKECKLMHDSFDELFNGVNVDSHTDNLNSNNKYSSHFSKIDCNRISSFENTNIGLEEKSRIRTDEEIERKRLEALAKLTGSPGKSKNFNGENKFTSTVSNIRQSIQTNSGKVEFFRTQSFEMANIGSDGEINLKRCTQDEIERKRLEALAKLEAKQKSDRTLATQCSFEEIEQKRLQALAKVEAKRQQDIIERKRQEALKRLQMKRQKNATAVKSSLATRLK